MPYRFMNISELASYLGLDARQVEKMAQRGQLPCQKIGGEYRCNRAELTDWLQQQMGTMGHEDLASMDAGITQHREEEEDAMIVSSLLHENAICMQLNARTKNSVLRELVALANETGLVYDGESILEAMVKREELCSTAMDGGIAIPHPRRPLPYALAEPLVVVAKTEAGIGYGAPDGRLTDLFFMICAQDDHQHLHVLARLCRMLHDADFVVGLRNVQSVESVIEHMAVHERKIVEDRL